MCYIWWAKVDTLLLTEVYRAHPLFCTFYGFGFCPLQTRPVYMLEIPWIWFSPYPPVSPTSAVYHLCSVVFLMKEKYFWYRLMSISKMRKWKTRKTFMFPESRWEASLSFTHICWLHSPNSFLSLRYMIDSSFLLQLCPLCLQPGRIPTIEEDGTLQDCRRPSIFPGHPILAPPLAPFQLLLPSAPCRKWSHSVSFLPLSAFSRPCFPRDCLGFLCNERMPS